MPTIHPSERPPLGWLVPCLTVGDLGASVEWYAQLGLRQVGGVLDEGWACLRSRAVELHLFSGHFEPSPVGPLLLNFRGGDVKAVAAALVERGLTRRESPMGAIFDDPQGRACFFDADQDERKAYDDGYPLTMLDTPEDDIAALLADPRQGTDADGPLLGNLSLCLAVDSLEQTRAFYTTLGFQAGGATLSGSSGWQVFARPDHVPAPGKPLIATYLTAFEKMLPGDMLNLRGGDVAAVAAHLEAQGIDLGDGVQIGEDGGESLMLSDPDGFPVFFDTTPPERLY